MISLYQVIVGLGGVGKSEIAVEYAYRHAYEYDQAIWWIDAESDGQILAAYRDFAVKKKLIEEEAKPDDVREAVRNGMQGHENWLFIFDNADDERENKPYRLLEPYLPGDLRGRRHVLITSRFSLWRGFAEAISVEMFSPREVTNFLSTATGLPTDEAQTELAQELGYLPLALWPRRRPISRCINSAIATILTGSGNIVCGCSARKPTRHWSRKRPFTSHGISL